MGNKVALVTGGSRGIGQAIALKLAGNGYDVVINYSGNEEQALKVCEMIKKIGQQALVIKANVANYEEVLKMSDMIMERFGRIDVLINNAGIVKDNLLLRMSDKDFDDVITINLKGTFNCIKAISKIMYRQKSGNIINISSVIGLIGNIGQANYAASKAGIIGLGKTCARELASKNIRVNTICPGFIKTNMTEQLSLDVQEKLLANILLKRLGEPEDVANLVEFLVSDKSSYITGQTFNVDGGMVL